jgi:uncharacterized protein
MPAPHDISIAFGHIWHRRLRPAGNAFRYRGFFLRIPMHRLASGVSGNALFGIDRPALMSFHRADHGLQGQDALDWIRQLLGENGLQDAGAQIWLHTFPRVLGYVFKPVSFWFCHTAEGPLMAVVAEVNNTFGERHFYLLSAPDARPLGNGALLSATKVFHVSPFCPVRGRYQFRFVNRTHHSLARIDYHDDQGPLLLTSLSGALKPLDAAACIRALLTYPVFTVSVIARIHWQALRLIIKRVPFFAKPSAPPSTISHGSP